MHLRFFADFISCQQLSASSIFQNIKIYGSVWHEVEERIEFRYGENLYLPNYIATGTLISSAKKQKERNKFRRMRNNNEVRKLFVLVLCTSNTIAYE